MAQLIADLWTPIILQECLSQAVKRRPLLSAISLDMSAESIKYLGEVKTRLVGTPTVQAFKTGAQDQTDTSVTVKLDQLKEVHIKLGPDEYAASGRNIFQERISAICEAMAEHLVGAVAAKWTAANFTNATTVASGWSYTNTLLPIRAALVARGVDLSKSFLAINGTVYNSLLGDEMVVSAMNNEANSSAIQTGCVPQLAGLGVHEYANCPTTGNMVGFAGSKESVLLVNRALSEAPNTIGGRIPFPGEEEVVVEPETGLTVKYQQWLSPGDMVANFRVLMLYGVAVGNPTTGQRLVTA